MQKQVIYTKDCLVQYPKEEMTDGEFSLHYVINDIKYPEQAAVYEIGVEKCQSGKVVETAYTGGITFCLEQAKKWVGILCRNQITPCCLLEVVDDMQSL